MYSIRWKNYFWDNNPDKDKFDKYVGVYLYVGICVLCNIDISSFAVYKNMKCVVIFVPGALK